MVDKNTYYVMVVPTSKASVKFRPCVLEYGLDFEKAKEVTEIRTYTEDPHGFDAFYKPF